jgi:hypothetical protein
LTMPRKLKVKISSELLIELEKCKSILNWIKFYYL